MVWITGCRINIGLFIDFIVIELVSVFVVALRVSTYDVPFITGVFNFLAYLSTKFGLFFHQPLTITYPLVDFRPIRSIQLSFVNILCFPLQFISPVACIVERIVRIRSCSRLKVRYSNREPLVSLPGLQYSIPERARFMPAIVSAMRAAWAAIFEYGTPAVVFQRDPRSRQRILKASSATEDSSRQHWLELLDSLVEELFDMNSSGYFDETV